MTKEAHKKPKKKTTTGHPSRAAHAATKKVFDITRPGKSPASPTSRPVAVSVKPPVPDDQFVPSAPPLRASDPSAKHDLMDAKNKKALRPLGAPEVAATATPPVASAAEPAASVVPAAAPSAPSAPAVSAVTPSEAPASLAAEPASVAQAPAPAPGVPDVPPATATDSRPAPEPEDSPARLALEQTVEDSSKVPIWEHPDTSQQVEEAPRASHSPAGNKSIEDLLAETGAPQLEPEQTPSLIVSHHHTRHSVWSAIGIFFLVLLVGVIVLDLLLDAGVITTGLDVPYTDFL